MVSSPKAGTSALLAVLPKEQALEAESSYEVDSTTRGSAGGESSFHGTAPDGMADVSEAEFTESEESVEEFIELLSLEGITAPVGVETIIGTDQRVKVNPTTTYPGRAVALITFDGGRCTGWLYGKDIVATAGHCVHTGGSNGAWRTNVRVYPGRNGSSSPYGSCAARRLHSVDGWTRDGNQEYDYGAIKLNCSIGNTTGWFGYWWQSASLQNLPSIISGYPGDKPLEQWRSNDSIRVSQTNKVFYQNDTVGGMSGSAVYYNRPSGSPFCSGVCSMGIHAYGLFNGPPYNTNNSATRITEARFNNLKAWKDAA
jgi:glutamyl endopeptidase